MSSRFIQLCPCYFVYRPSDELHQQQAAQPLVYASTPQTYENRPPAAVGPTGDRWTTEASGRMIPTPLTVSPALVKSETVPSTATTYAPYQTSAAEQTSGILPPNIAVSQSENWNQYGATDDPEQGQTASSDMQRYMASTTDFYDVRQNVNVSGQGVGENGSGNPSGLEVSTSSMPSARGVSSSALRQPASTPGSGKKTVTFHENIATEYAIRQSYGSTSSDSSFVALSPPEMSSGYDSVMYQSPFGSYGSQIPR